MVISYPSGLPRGPPGGSPSSPMVHPPATLGLGDSEPFLSGCRAIGTPPWGLLSLRLPFPPRQPFRLQVGTQTANSHSTSQQAWVSTLSLKSPQIYSTGLASALTLSAPPSVSTPRSLQPPVQTRSFTASFPSIKPFLVKTSSIELENLNLQSGGRICPCTRCGVNAALRRHSTLPS